MRPLNCHAAARRTPVRAIAPRAIMELVVYAASIAFLSVFAWRILAPFKPEVLRILSVLPTDYWTLVCMCAVLFFLALQIPGIGAAIAAGVWEARESRHTVRCAKGCQS
ncbi:hypothetical protein B0G71_8209 [Paraburkholderia sp. BL27I4N3]|uniref:hypothetical protein n=1 Tax=Paraburkholderia sp. BL27I4N3 TaxID=1938805 RepID=UPI000E37B1DA|nr:hypothetical protein [Paraburkholderia sp. BL27I4N3]REE06531.1 hypothetical protein B0G71_8209 [Paraburkholderia sp. BL27I4N3]